MRLLRYSINVTLDGCVDHRAGIPDEELHRYSSEIIGRADALILGRVTYQMMETAWRPPLSESGMPDWTAPFAETIRSARKYVVSRTLPSVDWNAELLTGDPVEAVRRLKEEPGGELYVGGVTLPLALANAGLIDEYEFIVAPTIAGHGPTLFEGLVEPLALTPINLRQFSGGAVATTYVPASATGNHSSGPFPVMIGDGDVVTDELVAKVRDA